MSKLLTAGFSRVFKKKTFYICLIIMAVNGVLNALSIYSDKALGYNSTLDSIFFEYVPFIPILMSVFCALFIGTEYSDGTMRNKIVSGHKRSTIYLSNFIICAAVTGDLIHICLKRIPGKYRILCGGLCVRPHSPIGFISGL